MSSKLLSSSHRTPLPPHPSPFPGKKKKWCFFFLLGLSVGWVGWVGRLGFFVSHWVLNVLGPFYSIFDSVYFTLVSDTHSWRKGFFFLFLFLYFATTVVSLGDNGIMDFFPFSYCSFSFLFTRIPFPPSPTPFHVAKFIVMIYFI